MNKVNYCASCGTPIRRENGVWVHYRHMDHKPLPKTEWVTPAPVNIGDAWRFDDTEHYDCHFAIAGQDFGGDIMRIGEATVKYTGIDGVRVKVVGEDEGGTVYLCYINPNERLVQIWVNMDSGCARCFRPRHLVTEDGSLLMLPAN